MKLLLLFYIFVKSFYINENFKYYTKYKITHFVINNKKIELLNYIKLFFINNDILIKGKCIEAIYKFKNYNNNLKIIYKQLFNEIKCSQKRKKLENNLIKIIENSNYYNSLENHNDWKIIISKDNNFLIMKHYI